VSGAPFEMAIFQHSSQLVDTYVPCCSNVSVSRADLGRERDMQVT
jgi:hypothetical protein